jgi:hypothetical protein
MSDITNIWCEECVFLYNVFMKYSNVNRNEKWINVTFFNKGGQEATFVNLKQAPHFFCLDIISVFKSVT